MGHEGAELMAAPQEAWTKVKATPKDYWRGTTNARNRNPIWKGHTRKVAAGPGSMRGEQSKPEDWV